MYLAEVGRSDSYATEFDLEADEHPGTYAAGESPIYFAPLRYVPVPKGDVHKKKEVVQVRFGFKISFLRVFRELKVAGCDVA